MPCIIPADDGMRLAINSDTILAPISHIWTRDLLFLINRNRSSLGAWLPWVSQVLTRQDLNKLIHYYRKKNQQTGAFTSCILHHGQVAGVVSINHISMPDSSASLGYWLGAEFRKKGLMRGACSTLLDHIFFTLKLHRVSVYCATENLSSQKIPESLGFKKEALLRDGEWLNDHYVDSFAYSILEWQWLQRRLSPAQQNRQLESGVLSSSFAGKTSP